MIHHNLNSKEQKNIESKNVRKFSTHSEAFDYLEREVFSQEHFSNHITETAKRNKVSYILAYDVITNHLTDILYEIDKAIAVPEEKVKIRAYGYFSLQIGFMISNNRNKLVKMLINKRTSK